MGRVLRVEADGGSRGNPGVAGYGALVRDPASGEVLVELAEPLGTASNNVAEYRGMIAGLQAAADLDPSADVEVAMDSKLVVEQMAGRWKIKHADMRRLALEGRDVVARIEQAGGSVSFTWMPRAENGPADALSNRGMDGESVDTRTDGGEPVLTGTSSAPEAAAEVGATVPPSPDPRGPATRVLLVRHGVTSYTEQARLDGRDGADPSLSELGQAQAAAAAQAARSLIGDGREDVTVVTSSLARAQETGALVAEALGVRAEVDADWDEQDFGDWDGEVLRELVATDPEAMRALRDDPHYARPGGESHEDLARRVLQAWSRVVARGGTVVVACHRKPILVVLCHVLGVPHERMWRLAGDPGSLTGLTAWTDGEAVLSFSNRT